jgi:ketopantoate reductase
MKILVFGAAVIGTLYAARLQEVGHRETILARSLRLADIRRYDLVLADIVSVLDQSRVGCHRSAFCRRCLRYGSDYRKEGSTD